MAEALWRECAKWLIQCQVLPQDHKVTWSTSEVIDLANTLRDGVVLCQLLNKLSPGCIDMKEISLRPQMSQFLCQKNIRTFLQTCQSVFNLKLSDLFEVFMLFEYLDFGKVLHTLSVLSKSAKAEASGIRGFPASNSKSHDYYNDEIYRNLEDVANEGFCGDYGDYDGYPVDDDIYEDLCSFQRNSQIPVVPVAPLEKRDYCIKELVETEKNYIEALNMIIKYFMRGLKGVLKPEDRKVIFFGVKELAEVHTGFHSDLYKACTSNQHKISDCFLHWKEKLVIYGDYCSNLLSAQELIDDLCMRNEIINQSVLRCQMEANEGRFRLRDLLSVPMQRVLKYHLLMKELIRNTPKTHDDYSGLEKALDAMLDLAQYINEVKRDTETLQIMKDIQSSITDLNMPENTELKYYGRLLKDGELKIRKHDDNRLKNRYIFVFDRMVLMCKATRMMDKVLWGDQYSYKEALWLADYKVENVTSVKSGTKDKWCHYWFLAHKQNKTAFTMYAKTEDNKRKWIESIERALDNISPASLKYTDHTFAMHTFEKAVSCACCEKLLRGIFNQGYKCDTCCIPVHKQCIASARSCGAPSLPPRPPPLGSLGSVSSEDCIRPMDHNFHSFPICKVRAKQFYKGDGFSGMDGLRHLSFETNECIYVTRKLNSAWWEGRSEKTGEEGIFPVDSVEDVLNSKRVSYEDPVLSVNMNRSSVQSNPHEGYVNLNLEEFPWFAGYMDRDAATVKLERMPTGTFLVRLSLKQNGGFAISLSYNNQVKHMRVCTTEDGQLYYLSSSKFFKTIVEMVRWYEENSLAESFSGLNITLMVPFRKVNGTVDPIGHAVAVYDFEGSSTTMLTLQKGDQVILLSKAGDEKGWWKGQVNERVGYFPRSYVKEVGS